MEKSHAKVAAPVANGEMDHLGAYVTDDDRSPNLRRVPLDLIEEYARQLGHADLIRESVDGLAREEPR